MTSAFENALSLYEARFGEGMSQTIRRVDPYRDQGLMLTRETAEETRWFLARPHELEEVYPERDPHLPVAREIGRLLAEARVDVLAWRPGRRIAMKITTPEDVVLLKGYRKRRSRPAAEAHAAARDARRRSLSESSERGFRIPALLEHDEERETLTLEWFEGAAPGLVPGHAPGHVGLARDSGDLFFRIGHKLRLFHAASGSGRLEHTRVDECAILETLAARVLDLTEELPVGWREFADKLAAQAAVAAPIPGGERSASRLLHRDLHDGQILVTPGGLALLDFDLCCRGEPALDVGNLTAHLALRAMQSGIDSATIEFEAAADALLEGYDRVHEPEFLESLRFYQAGTFLRLALLYSLRPRWRALSPDLIELARQCLEDVRIA